MKIKDREARGRSRKPTNPKRRRSEKGKEKMVEEPPKEAGKGRKKQIGDLPLEMGFFLEMIELPAFISQTIDMLGWRNFCEGAQPIQPTVIRTLYKGRLHKEQDSKKLME